MRIGYAGINKTVGCTAGAAFHLKSYTPERFVETVDNNIGCLEQILKFNAYHNILFFRISSSLIPFASHSACDVPWQRLFRDKLSALGAFIRNNGMRISMHPGSFNILNSPRSGIVTRTIRELEYHADLLELLGLDGSAKIQIHVGGVYGDKERSTRRFVAAYRALPERLKKRLIAENDGLRYDVNDCLQVHAMTGIPVVFDVLHHESVSPVQTAREGFILCSGTWRPDDGPPMVDYGTQKEGGRPGSHAEFIDIKRFEEFVESIQPRDCDIIIEAKGKEKNALKAVEALRRDPRLVIFSPA